MSIIFWLIVSLILITLLELTYVIITSKNDGPFPYMFILKIIVLLIGIIYPILILFSNLMIFTESYAIFFWKMSIITEIVSAYLINLIFCFLTESKKVNFLSILILSIIGSLILSNQFDSLSVSIAQIGDYYYYLHDNYSKSLIILFHAIFIGLLIYYLIQFWRKPLSISLSLLLSFLSLSMISFLVSYFLLIITMNKSYLVANLLSIIIAVIIALIVYIKKPNLYIRFSIKLEYITIFHKSGILLYSYNFEQGKEIEESFLKGSILIGINSTLNSFLDKKNQLDYIQIRDKFAYFDFNKQYGYALLLIANKTNKMIKKSIKEFIDLFTQQNKDYLEEINQNMALIDLSHFKNTNQLIKKVFHTYFINNKDSK